MVRRANITFKLKDLNILVCEAMAAITAEYWTKCIGHMQKEVQNYIFYDQIVPENTSLEIVTVSNWIAINIKSDIAKSSFSKTNSHFLFIFCLIFTHISLNVGHLFLACYFSTWQFLQIFMPTYTGCLMPFLLSYLTQNTLTNFVLTLNPTCFQIWLLILILFQSVILYSFQNFFKLFCLGPTWWWHCCQYWGWRNHWTAHSIGRKRLSVKITFFRPWQGPYCSRMYCRF